jgi:hypothetical protein
LPAVQCCFAMCPAPAIMRVRTKTGWANVCEKHEIEIRNREVRQWLRSVGLEREPGESMKAWMARTIAWLKANAEKQKRVRGFKSAGSLLVVPRQREPGDDDEEVAA